MCVAEPISDYVCIPCGAYKRREDEAFGRVVR